jgi:hypothetical protein
LKGSDKKKLWLLLAIVIGAVTWNVIAHYHVKNFHERVHSKPMRYSYDMTRGVARPVMLITELRYKERLVAYYDKLSRGELSPAFNFPLNSILFQKPVHLVGATPDSQLVEVVYYTTEDKYGNYIKGYVDRRTLKDAPIPDSVLNRKIDYSYDNVYYQDSINSLE